MVPGKTENFLAANNTYKKNNNTTCIFDISLRLSQGFSKSPARHFPTTNLSIENSKRIAARNFSFRQNISVPETSEKMFR